MAQFTRAYSKLTDRLVEVAVLRRLGASYERRDAIACRKEINALSRGAVVLLCSHLEAYVRELGAVALDSMVAKDIPRTKLASRVYYHIPKDLLEEVRSTLDPEKAANKVFAFIDSDLEYWSKDGPFPGPVPVERFNRGFANPAFKKIVKYFNRFGYKGYRGDLMACLQARFQPTVTMVDHLVDTRNKIAHGDFTAIKTPGEVKDMASMIQVFCRSTDAVFATWWRKSFCAIR